MTISPHAFSIPVMGTGHSIDSPIRVAPFGIDSVISVVDDLLVERLRKHYCQKFELPYKNIPRNADDGRANRITAYLECVKEIVYQKFESIRSLSFFETNDKAKYFEMLPDYSYLKQRYDELMQTGPGSHRKRLVDELSYLMEPGSIDVNIMAKVDKLNYTKQGEPMDPKFSDANAALRGYANSSLSSKLILSAGFNPNLYGYLSDFEDFYRDAVGQIKKKIILKVSDFRSALIQGKFLAKKGLEVYEYRIESGLNCGGHAFASEGLLLPTLLKEFREKKETLNSTIKPMVEKFYEENREGFSSDWSVEPPRLTVQGGIGVNGEKQRLMNDFEMESTGWGSPFLLVPEATAVDTTTRKLLQEAKEADLYLSGVSPLGVPFNNVRNTGSEQWHRREIEKGKPGSPCPKNFLKSNTEFTEIPICTASKQYQTLKLDEIEQNGEDAETKAGMRKKVLEKACLCDHLGNGALIETGTLNESRAPQSICPGPNIAWFNREYTLREMVDHIYGKTASLVSPDRTHMFAKEIILYVDYLKRLIDEGGRTKNEVRRFSKFRKNLEEGIEYCMEIADSKPYKGENLDSIKINARVALKRLEEMFQDLEPEPAIS